jgi:uncharacterized membrane protein YjjB (DUF3815 family)
MARPTTSSADSRRDAMSVELARTIATTALWSGTAAVGFAVLFNVPRRLLPACFLLGALGLATRTLLMKLGLVGIEAATLGASMVVGFAALGFARRSRVPSMVYALPAAIPMVPGAFAFKTMLGVLRLVGGAGATHPALAVEAVVAAAKTALILAAIAVGVGSAGLLLRQSDTAELDPR